MTDITWDIHTHFNEELAPKAKSLSQKWYSGTLKKLWAKDASVWTGSDESKWLGWLESPFTKNDLLERLEKLTEQVQSRGIKDVVLLGMGGSALGARCIQRLMTADQNAAILHVLDSTFPADVEAVEKKIDIKNTLFIVSSKSGGTLETRLLLEHFWVKNSDPTYFVAVTDKGSSLEKLAQERGFLDIYHGDKAIGGRYSVFSPFGIVPLAAAGFDCSFIIESARAAHTACQAQENNPGLDLGIALGLGVREGQNLIYLEGIGLAEALKPWTDQLFAESTGKDGKGMLPVDVLPTLEDGSKQILHIRCGSEINPADLQQSNAPCAVILKATSLGSIIGSLFIFEFATAVAGSIIGINPFDQPNVESSKVACRKIMESSGETKFPEPVLKSDNLSFFFSEASKKHLSGADASLEEMRSIFTAAVQEFEALGLLFWASQTLENTQSAKAMAHTLADSCARPVMAAFGPGFLHSVGQAYKGAADDVFYLQIVQADGKGDELSKAVYAQGWGDFQAMSSIGRRVIRCEISGGEVVSLEKLTDLLKKNPA